MFRSFFNTTSRWPPAVLPGCATPHIVPFFHLLLLLSHRVHYPLLHLPILSDISSLKRQEPGPSTTLRPPSVPNEPSSSRQGRKKRQRLRRKRKHEKVKVPDPQRLYNELLRRGRRRLAAKLGKLLFRLRKNAQRLKVAASLLERLSAVSKITLATFWSVSAKQRNKLQHTLNGNPSCPLCSQSFYSVAGTSMLHTKNVVCC